MQEEWSIEDLLRGKSVEEIEQDLLRDTAAFERVREELTRPPTPQRIREIIVLQEDISYALGQVLGYYNKIFSVNSKDQQALAVLGRYEQLAATIGNKTLFFTLWLMNLDEKEASKYTTSQELREYRYLLESIRRDKPYTKSEEVEQVITLKSTTGRGAFADVMQIFTSSFSYSIKGQQGLTFSELASYMQGSDSEARKEAYTTLLSHYTEHKAVLCEIYKNIVNDWNNTGMTIRGYASPIAIRNSINDIDDEAVQTLLSVVRKNAVLFHDFFALKHKINARDGAAYPYSRYHIYAPYAKAPSTTYDYEMSKKLVLESYEDFDKRFGEAAKTIFAARHVHSHPRPHKRSGAYCSFGGRGVAPYILLNHTDNLRDVFTMMHEVGHGIHDLFTDIHPYSLAHPCLPMAETGSITGETILSRSLLAKAPREEKIAMLMQIISDRWSSIVRQAYFVLFEMQAHELIREGATSEMLDEAYYTLLKEQFGDMEIPEAFRHEWNIIPHIHETPFYCYAYAWGNLLALSLFALIEKEGQEGKEKLYQTLQAGGSRSPKDILAAIGIDPCDEAFWQGGFDIIKAQIEELRVLST